MRISVGDVSLWFDVSGPSVIPQGDTTAERPVLVAVHGGPGLDYMMVKPALEPLAADFQVLYFTELEERFAGRIEPITEDAGAEIEQAAWPYSRHLLLQFGPDGAGEPDAEDPGWSDHPLTQPTRSGQVA